MTALILVVLILAVLIALGRMTILNAVMVFCVLLLILMLFGLVRVS